MVNEFRIMDLPTIDEMPELRSDLVQVKVVLSALDAVQTDRHAEFVDALVEYLVTDGEDVIAEDLTFLKALQIGPEKYWIWEYIDNAGEKYYVTASESEKGTRRFGWDIAEDLSPEQHVLGDFYACY